MKVITVKPYDNIPAGSVISVTNQDRTRYKGIWASPVGSFYVTVPKNNCREFKEKKETK